jgi:dihydroxyacetone kinase
MAVAFKTPGLEPRIVPGRERPFARQARRFGHMTGNAVGIVRRTIDNTARTARRRMNVIRARALCMPNERPLPVVAGMGAIGVGIGIALRMLRSNHG